MKLEVILIAFSGYIVLNGGPKPNIKVKNFAGKRITRFEQISFDSLIQF
jgi:hypothetical protein